MISKMDIDPTMSKDMDQLLDTCHEDFELALKHYGISCTGFQEMIRNVQEWYNKQNHLPKGLLHDQVISRHLLLKGFSLEEAKKNIDSYFIARNKIPDLACKWDLTVPKYLRILKSASIVVFPKKTPNNKRITLFRLTFTDNVYIVDVIKTVLMMSEYRLWNDTATGDYWIYDLSCANLQLAVQFTPTLIANTSFYNTKVFAPKISGMYIVNLPSYGELGLNLFKKTMKLKVMQRLRSFNSLTDAIKEFPSNIIPVDLGGSEISCQEIAEKWVTTLQSQTWTKYYRSLDNCRSDETKRITPLKKNESFGVQGSFRNLGFD